MCKREGERQKVRGEGGRREKERVAGRTRLLFNVFVLNRTEAKRIMTMGGINARL